MPRTTSSYLLTCSTHVCIMYYERTPGSTRAQPVCCMNGKHMTYTWSSSILTRSSNLLGDDPTALPELPPLASLLVRDCQWQAEQDVKQSNSCCTRVRRVDWSSVSHHRNDSCSSKSRRRSVHQSLQVSERASRTRLRQHGLEVWPGFAVFAK